MLIPKDKICIHGYYDSMNNVNVFVLVKRNFYPTIDVYSEDRAIVLQPRFAASFISKTYNI